MGLFSSSQPVAAQPAQPVQPRQSRGGLFSRRRDPVQPRTTRGGLFSSSKPVHHQPRTSGGGLFSRRRKPVHHTHHTPAATTAGTTSRRHQGGGLTGTSRPATTATVGTKTKPSRGLGLFRRRERRHEPTMGEKVSGAATRAKGTVTGDPVARDMGARRMQGYEEPTVRRSPRF
ncbi:hypothetical protein SODALDRAFT_353640 [Sodiomyces alkalinus F11]|uniref:Uncharacterized protein n=1 Tax=Sodiomyces alkalinus (strain CBS 110278 / VKM F-3762 / F11) TaxID=1314773 RepID=A0A3N2PJD3_SODAK|nr:hypothetical protein SODALDRAFT_353640 [Sodiomyces alkalinus F11]ROT34637.1 hypothetical protein SODALDRAFT_353640 [Sodiomyces alkalinus F11]